MPSSDRADSRLIESEASGTSWSSNPTASRIDPCAVRAISSIAAASTCTFSVFAMCVSRPTICSSLCRRNTNC